MFDDGVERTRELRWSPKPRSLTSAQTQAAAQFVILPYPANAVRHSLFRMRVQEKRGVTTTVPASHKYRTPRRDNQGESLKRRNICRPKNVGKPRRAPGDKTPECLLPERSQQIERDPEVQLLDMRTYPRIFLPQ